MSGKQNKDRDPVKRAAKRKAQREALARGSKMNPRDPAASQSQMTHASSGSAGKRARDGDRRLRGERRDP